MTTVIEGGRVRLRPLQKGDLDKVVAAAMEFETEGRSEAVVRENLRERIRTSGEMTEREFLLGIEAGGRLVGDIQAFRAGTPRGVFDVGISLFDEVDRRKGYGSEAIQLFIAHLFEQCEAHRVQLSTDVTNAGMRGAALKLGFSEEGIMRGFWPEPDGPHDYVMYGMTRANFERSKT